VPVSQRKLLQQVARLVILQSSSVGYREDGTDQIWHGFNCAQLGKWLK